MALIAQISGMYQSNQSSLFALKEKLEQCGVTVTHPLSDGFIFTENSPAPTVVSGLWTPYESNLDYFQAIDDDDFYTVSNDNGIINQDMARGILYAIMLGKPIVLMQAPVFSDDVSAFARTFISAKLPYMRVLNLLTLSKDEAREAVASMTRPVEYDLSDGERRRIQRGIRTYFRMLLPKNRATVSTRAAVLAA